MTRGRMKAEEVSGVSICRLACLCFVRRGTTRSSFRLSLASTWESYGGDLVRLVSTTSRADPQGVDLTASTSSPRQTEREGGRGNASFLPLSLHRLRLLLVLTVYV